MVSLSDLNNSLSGRTYATPQTPAKLSQPQPTSIGNATLPSLKLSDINAALGKKKTGITSTVTPTSPGVAPVNQVSVTPQTYSGPVESGSPLTVGQRAALSFGDVEGEKAFVRKLGYNVLYDEGGNTLLEKGGKVYSLDEKNFNLVKDTADLLGMLPTLVGTAIGASGGPVGLAAGGGIGDIASQLIGKTLGTRESFSPLEAAGSAAAGYVGGVAGELATPALRTLAPQFAEKYALGTTAEKLPGFLAREAVAQPTFGGAAAGAQTLVQTGDIKRAAEAVPGGALGGLIVGLPMAGAFRAFSMPSRARIEPTTATGGAIVPRAETGIIPYTESPHAPINIRQPGAKTISVEPDFGTTDVGVTVNRLPTAPIEELNMLQKHALEIRSGNEKVYANRSFIVEAAHARIQELETKSVMNALAHAERGTTGPILTDSELAEYRFLKSNVNDPEAIADTYSQGIGDPVEVPVVAPETVIQYTEAQPPKKFRIEDIAPEDINAEITRLQERLSHIETEQAAASPAYYPAAINEAESIINRIDRLRTSMLARTKPQETVAPITPKTTVTAESKNVDVTSVRPGDTIERGTGEGNARVKEIEIIDDGDTARITFEDNSTKEFGANETVKKYSEVAAEAPKVQVTPTPTVEAAKIPGVGPVGETVTETRVAPETAPEGSPIDRVIQKITGGTRGLEAQREEISARQRAARAERASELGALEESYRKGELSLEQYRQREQSILSGELTSRKVTGENPITQDDMDSIVSQIIKSNRLTSWEKVNLSAAFRDLFEKNVVPQPNQLELMEIEFGKKPVADILDAVKTGTKLSQKIVTGANVMKSLVSMADFSAFLRQGLIQTVSHPVKSATALGKAIKWAFDAKSYDDWFQTVLDSPWMRTMREYKIPLDVVDPTSPTAKLTAREEAFMADAAPVFDKIPVVGKFIKAVYLGSERAYTGFLNKLRWDTFTSEASKLLGDGYTLQKDPEVFRSLARWINTSTGRGDLGALNKSVPALNAVLFSPKLMKARLDILNPLYYTKLSPEVRRLAMFDMAKLIGTGITLLGLAKLGGAEVEDDPRSSDFGKIKVGDTRWDIWGGLQQYVSFFTRLGLGQIKTGAGDILRLDKDVAPYTTRWDLMARFLRGKTSPALQLGINALSGEDLAGEQFSPDLGQVWKNIAPFYVQDITDAANSAGWGRAAAVGIPTIFGIGTQTYPESNMAKAKAIAEELVLLPDEEKTARFAQIAQEDEKLADTVLRRYKDMLMDINDYDRYMKGLPIERRAQVIVDKLESFKDEGAQQEYWNELISKRILTADVYREIYKILGGVPDITQTYEVSSPDGNAVVMQLDPSQIQQAVAEGYNVQ